MNKDKDDLENIENDLDKTRKIHISKNLLYLLKQFLNNTIKHKTS